MKEKIIYEIIEKEGSYVNDPADSGGETKYGITQQTALNHGITKPIIELTKEDAFKIYEESYWHALKLDKVLPISDFLAKIMADFGVLMGVSRVAKYLQRSLNIYNNKGSSYPDISVDGIIGEKTIATLQQYHVIRKKEGIDILSANMLFLFGNFVFDLAERREKDEKFIYGWHKRIFEYLNLQKN